MKMTQGANDLAPLSDFVVTETIHKSQRRKVSIYSWPGYLTTPLSISHSDMTITFYADEPRDVEVVPTDEMLVAGWKIKWEPV